MRAWRRASWTLVRHVPGYPARTGENAKWRLQPAFGFITGCKVRRKNDPVPLTDITTRKELGDKLGCWYGGCYLEPGEYSHLSSAHSPCRRSGEKRLYSGLVATRGVDHLMLSCSKCLRSFSFNHPGRLIQPINVVGCLPFVGKFLVWPLHIGKRFAKNADQHEIALTI